MARLKTINEVQALKSVFYRFFEMKDVQGKDNARDKVLISMQVPETCLNPYYNYDEEDDKRLSEGIVIDDPSMPVFPSGSYVSNYSAILDHHLKRLDQRRLENPNFDQE